MSYNLYNNNYNGYYYESLLNNDDIFTILEHINGDVNIGDCLLCNIGDNINKIYKIHKVISIDPKYIKIIDIIDPILYYDSKNTNILLCTNNQVDNVEVFEKDIKFNGIIGDSLPNPTTTISNYCLLNNGKLYKKYNNDWILTYMSLYSYKFIDNDNSVYVYINIIG